MLLKYPLTASQYARFQHASNDAEIRALAERAGVAVTAERMVGGVETWFFRGRCSGTMALVPVGSSGVSLAGLRLQTPAEPHHWECWIRVQSKPFWLPWFVLDWGFRKALE